MTLKRPEKYTGVDAECEEGRIWNGAITEYELYLADLLKEIREILNRKMHQITFEETYSAIRKLIERVDHEN